ncbi:MULTISPECIES: L,D-transpeptidase [Phyllobacteriaceae]|jgi:lipoprotein-anchoring transpeptidase ErfK/SrfK|uniref:L,D-TPase catalytic domain-containing protein n=2 Tax=Pseudomonadota TaxID=1224 RepID=A0A1C2DJ21_9HYPH|nr:MULTISPECIES: L,D-transpeptidase [Mesorhizobium]MBN9233156.1 L,D-transpeptidase [Mesorhizobium sp.]MDQ0332157.1 lipoprotein-anchoring transpeptidase ErfK/SrfK [Mesorhizobium sp. YL-MeA3-2017]OCX14769.1 hypothetical protein QV13_20320 [Mesorhizobium hungaricum]
MLKTPTIPMTRRGFLNTALVGAASMALAACTTVSQEPPPVVAPPPPPPPADPILPDYAVMYGPVVDENYEIPAIPYRKIDQQFLRQVVPDPTGEKPGTVVVETSTHFLYVVLPGGRALRYGVGLGRAGFAWSGTAVMQWKRKWPKWTPPEDMIKRQPELRKFSADNGGMPPGLKNPLGARALYLFQNGEDTLYRLHGSPEWSSIGKSVSSGCVRLINQDVIDLFDRVKNGAKVIVTERAGQPLVANSYDQEQGIPIDSGVPAGSQLLGPAGRSWF